jgi:uncharacterized membrane protein YidH (DUF202 family)
MILRKLESNPAKMTSVALAFIAIGLSLLTIGIAWPRFSPTLPHAGTDWNDFFRGVIFGIAIVIEIAGVAIAASAAKRRKTL